MNPPMYQDHQLNYRPLSKRRLLGADRLMPSLSSWRRLAQQFLASLTLAIHVRLLVWSQEPRALLQNLRSPKLPSFEALNMHAPNHRFHCLFPEDYNIGSLIITGPYYKCSNYGISQNPIAHYSTSLCSEPRWPKSRHRDLELHRCL